MKPIESLRATLNEILKFPWRQMLCTLWRRFREVRLGTTASSLTFITVLALVPLFTLGLAIFTAFPIFSQVQEQLQRWLIESLVPESISRQVLGSLTQFSRKASRLGLVGLIAVLVVSLALLVTIDRTLGQIWRVSRQRPWAQRVLIYWAGFMWPGWWCCWVQWSPPACLRLVDRPNGKQMALAGLSGWPWKS